MDAGKYTFIGTRAYMYVLVPYGLPSYSYRVNLGSMGSGVRSFNKSGIDGMSTRPTAQVRTKVKR